MNIDDEYNRLSNNIRRLLSKVSEIEKSHYFPKSVTSKLTPADITRMQEAAILLGQAVEKLDGTS